MRICALIGHTFYALGSILFVIFILPVVLLLTPFGQAAYNFLHCAMHSYLAFLTRFFLPALGIYTLKEFSGFEKLPGDKPVIVVANHRGKLDGPFLLGKLKNTVALIKSKYAVSPVYAILVKKLYFISLTPRSRDALEKALVQAKEVLARGKNLLVFPEGTRTASSRLLPFKELAFRIAKETKTAICPVVIYSKYELMTKQLKSFFPDKRNTFIIRCLPPVIPSDNEDPAELTARVREMMAKELAAIEKKENGSL